MAHTTKFSLLSLLVLLAISGQVLAGRQISKESKDADVKQPEFLHISDPSFLIPGFGRVLVPTHPHLGGSHPHPHPHLSIPSFNTPTGTGGGSYLPGRDDTLVPNPGYETPNPGYTGTPAPIRP